MRCARSICIKLECTEGHSVNACIRGNPPFKILNSIESAIIAKRQGCSTSCYFNLETRLNNNGQDLASLQRHHSDNGVYYASSRYKIYITTSKCQVSRLQNEKFVNARRIRDLTIFIFVFKWHVKNCLNVSYKQYLSGVCVGRDTNCYRVHDHDLIQFRWKYAVCRQ